MKYDRHKYKARNRAMILTEKAGYLLDASTFKLKEQFDYADIGGITVSHLADGVVVIKFPLEGVEGRGDLILKTDHVVEFVIKLALFAGKMQQVQINATRTIMHDLPKNKSGTITFQQG